MRKLSSLNASGETTLNIMIWIAVILVSIMMLYWYVDNFVFFKDKIEAIQADLSNLREKIDEACPTQAYKDNYNPYTETGTLTITERKICINSFGQEMCQTTICETNISTSTDLSKITTIFIEKNNGVISVYAP